MMYDVIDVVDQLQLKQYDVIGFSDGAILSLLLAKNDERVKHIVSIGANTKPSMIKDIYRITLYVQSICLLPFCLYSSKARYMRKLLLLMLKEPHIEYTSFQNIKIPALIMAGEFDMIKDHDTKMISESLPYGIMKIIKGGNHFLLRDFFQQTMKEIHLFLSACHKEE